MDIQRYAKSWAYKRKGVFSMEKNIVTKSQAIKQINEFLAENQANLNAQALKWLSEFEFNKTTEIINMGDFIELFSRYKGWGKKIIIKKDGSANLSIGNMF